MHERQQAQRRKFATKLPQSATPTTRDTWQLFMSSKHRNKTQTKQPKPIVPLQLAHKSAGRRKPVGRVPESSWSMHRIGQIQLRK